MCAGFNSQHKDRVECFHPDSEFVTNMNTVNLINHIRIKKVKKYINETTFLLSVTPDSRL